MSGSAAAVVRILGALFLLILTGLANVASADQAGAAADTAWREILALDAGPAAPAAGVRDRVAAAALARAHLDRQEDALRRFPPDFPSDPRRFAARIRLADVLNARARLLGQTEARTAARRLLEKVERDPAASAADRPDAAYARTSQLMQELGARPDPESAREPLNRAIRGFLASYPGDRREAALLAELATIYDDVPDGKRRLLEEARTKSAAGPEGDALRARIADDLKRLALLGRPLDMSLPATTPGSGASLPSPRLADHRGRVMVIIFWASWSAPALAELGRLQTLARRVDARQVEFLTVSLDEDPAVLAEAVRQLHITWPVFCDGRGWQGHAVRSLGLNALPTTWVLDARGVLQGLNARGRTEESLRRVGVRN